MGVTQRQNWVTVLESRKGTSCLRHGSELCGPQLGFEDPGGGQGAQNLPKQTRLRTGSSEGSPWKTLLAPAPALLPAEPLPSSLPLSLPFLSLLPPPCPSPPRCLSLWVSEAPGPCCKLSRGQEPRDRTSESNHTVSLSNTTSSSDFIQFK